MKYRVWVSLPDGKDHIPLLDSTDQQKAQQLMDVLVSSSSGVSLDIGASITDDGTPPQAAEKQQTGEAAAPPAEQPPAAGKHPRQSGR